MDLWAPQMIADFFGNDVLQDAEEFYHKEKEDEEDDTGTLAVVRFQNKSTATKNNNCRRQARFVVYVVHIFKI